MPPNVTPGYLKYLKGSAEDILNAAFPDEELITRAYRSRLRHVIEVYGGVREQLGDECADLVAALPYADSFGLQDATLGLVILEQTAAELQDLLDEDGELKRIANGEERTDDEADAQIRRDAAEWSQRHNVDRPKLDEYGQSARSLPSEIDDEGTRDSFYGRKGAEKAIQDSARDDARPPKQVTVKIPTTPTAPRDPSVWPADPKAPSPPPPSIEPAPTAAMPTPVPDSGPITPPAPRPAETLTITAESYADKDPAHAFRMGMTWLAENLTMVAVGSREHATFPRISPLTDLHTRLPEGAPATQAVVDLVAAVRLRFSKLRPPSGGGASDLVARLQNLDPNDPHSGAEALKELLGELTGRRRDDSEGDWEKPWGEGGWRD